MLIVGAKGFAKEVLEICYHNDQIEDLVFYDDVNADIGEMLYERFPILKNCDEAKEHFALYDNTFALGLGKPQLRYALNQKFKNMGGCLISTISPHSKIGNYGVHIGEGSNIMSGSLISNDVVIGKGCILYFNSILTHDCVIGDFVEISPNVTILGFANIGNYCQLGAGSIILPKVSIGENVVVGAGAVVTKDIPSNSLVVGAPAKVIKNLAPLKL